MSRHFLQPDDLGVLGANAPELAQVFVSLASDIALVLDEQGVVRYVAQDPDTPMVLAAESWVGQPWMNTVTDETRVKVQRMLSDLANSGMARRREVNQLSGVTSNVPVAYTALRLGGAGPALVVGRDLRTVSTMQQHFMRAQLETERGHWRARHSDSRHKLMLQVATDAVLSVDAQTLTLEDGNPAAEVLLQAGQWPLAGRALLQQFDAQTRGAVETLVQEAVNQGHSTEVQVRLAGSHMQVNLQALRLPQAGPRALHQAGPARLLLRARPTEALVTDIMPIEAALAKLVEGTRDGILVTDARGHALGANRTFLRMAQANDEDSIRGRPLAQWLGPIESDVAQLLESVRERGVVRGLHFDVGNPGSGAPGHGVTVIGMLLMQDNQVCLGFILRPQPAEGSTTPAASPLGLAQSIATLTANLGSSPLDELLREVEQLTRRHLVQRALDISGSDPAAAILLDVSEDQLARLKAEL